MRSDIFYQQSAISNKALNHWSKDKAVDDVFDSYIDNIKSGIKQRVTITTLDDFATDSTVFKMEVAIMNTQEYRRLKEIEKQYERILSDVAQWRWQNEKM